MSSERQSERGRLRRVGGIWKPKPGGKSKGSGSVTVNGWRQRFLILPNDRKEPGSSQPDYVLLSGDEPEPDDYAREHEAAVSRTSHGNHHADRDDEIPF